MTDTKTPTTGGCHFQAGPWECLSSTESYEELFRETLGILMQALSEKSIEQIKEDLQTITTTENRDQLNRSVSHFYGKINILITEGILPEENRSIIGSELFPLRKQRERSMIIRDHAQ